MLETIERPVLIIDGMNLFIRQYIRNPAMSSDGHHMGGVVGFLNATKRLVEMVHPSEVIVAWEGGGSARRRALFPDYKAHRKPPRLNRFYEDEIPDSAENRTYQLQALIGLMKHLPICQVYVEDCEADDVIGFLCKNTLKSRKKVVASSDKDMYQLLDPMTMAYSWSKGGRFVGPDDVLKEFNITANNFATAKAVCGDASDNVPGVKSVGFKTLSKRFPQLGLEADVSVSDIIEQCRLICEKDGPKASKMVVRINESADIIRRNWAVMYLDTSNLSLMQARKIDTLVSSFSPKKNMVQFMRQLIKEGLQSLDGQDIYSAFVSV